jgi:chloride channel protein, CIC family
VTHRIPGLRPSTYRALRHAGELLFGRGASPVLVIAAVLGAASGLLSAGFWEGIASLQAMGSYYLQRPLDTALRLPWSWASWVFLLPALGALMAGLLAVFVFRTPQRLGVPAVMLDARRNWGKMPLRYVPSTFFNSVLTIGTGGSAGREAPVVAMGGGLGAWVARRMALPPSQRRLLVGCGAAAAIAAAFNAPLAGVFFALELILGDWRSGTLGPVMVAAVAGTVVCRAAEGSADAAHFRVPPFHLGSWWEVFVYAGLGLLAGLVGQVFTSSMKVVEHRAERLPVPPWLRPALGGLGVGLLGLVLPGVLGNGYPWAAAACSGTLPLKLMLALVAGKILATALTLGSGGWGGDFAPVLVVGAMMGGVYGELAGVIAGHGALSGAGGYAMVGMGALLAAVIRCPFTAVLLLFELTGSYEVVLPVMVAVATASYAARRLSRLGLYHQRLHDLGGPAFEMWTEGSLTSLVVRDAMSEEIETLPENMPYGEVLRRVAGSEHSVFPVVRREGIMTGVVRLVDLRPHLMSWGADIPVVAAELAQQEVPLVTPAMPLDEAARLLTELGWDELPVVVSTTRPEPCGLISRHEVLRRAVATASSQSG